VVNDIRRKTAGNPPHVYTSECFQASVAPQDSEENTGHKTRGINWQMRAPKGVFGAAFATTEGNPRPRLARLRASVTPERPRGAPGGRLWRRSRPIVM
jgi:hypothetical protein